MVPRKTVASLSQYQGDHRNDRDDRDRRAQGEHRVFHFDRILIGNRWEDDVRLKVDDGGRIAALEPGGRPEGCERVTGWTIPGVPNVHSHSFQRGLAGLAEGRGPGSFWSWREVMYAFLEQLTPDDVEAITAQLHVEMLKAGFTCVGEFHYLHHARGGGRYGDPAEMSHRILAAARTSGIGLVHMPVVYEAGGFGGEPLEGGQRRFEMNLDEVARLCESLGGRCPARGIRTGLALHSLRAVSGETIARLEEFLSASGALGVADGREAGHREASAQRKGAQREDASEGGLLPRGRPPVHIHVAEQEKEVWECLATRGARPVEWLLDNAPVDERWCLVHATHASRDELAAVAEGGAVVGLCPTTEANLGDGLFPLGDLAGMGGRWGIGTDSHVSRSAVEELRLLEYGQRLATKRRSAEEDAVAGGEATAGVAGRANEDALAGAGGGLLAHAWRDGCQALAWNAGAVAVDARADLVVLDAEHPALVGREGSTVLDSWVFSGTESPVRHVMVGGDWVVRDGGHAREEEIRRGFVRTVRGLAERL